MYYYCEIVSLGLVIDTISLSNWRCLYVWCINKMDVYLNWLLSRISSVVEWDAPLKMWWIKCIKLCNNLYDRFENHLCVVDNGWGIEMLSEVNSIMGNENIRIWWIIVFNNVLQLGTLLGTWQWVVLIHFFEKDSNNENVRAYSKPHNYNGIHFGQICFSMPTSLSPTISFNKC